MGVAAFVWPPAASEPETDLSAAALARHHDDCDEDGLSLRGGD